MITIELRKSQSNASQDVEIDILHTKTSRGCFLDENSEGAEIFEMLHGGVVLDNLIGLKHLFMFQRVGGCYWTSRMELGAEGNIIIGK